MVVYLVGAGPGDPDLITLKAIKALKKANVVIYDRLANDEILKHAENADLIYVGKKAGEHYKKQDEINQILIDQGKKHENVVRLKGGDPFVFGRGGEEMLALLEEGIPCRIHSRSHFGHWCTNIFRTSSYTQRCCNFINSSYRT